jgi:hypothetical protein
MLLLNFITSDCENNELECNALLMPYDTRCCQVNSFYLSRYRLCRLLNVISFEENRSQAVETDGIKPMGIKPMSSDALATTG